MNTNVRLLTLNVVVCLVLGCAGESPTANDRQAATDERTSSHRAQIAGPLAAVAVETEQQDVPGPVTEVTNAINRQDWDALSKLASKLPTGHRYIEKWKQKPIQVGELKRVQRDAKFEGKPCLRYSFQMKFKDGSLHPHWLVLFVNETPDQPRLLDFYEFGW